MHIFLIYLYHFLGFFFSCHSFHYQPIYFTLLQGQDSLFFFFFFFHIKKSFFKPQKNQIIILHGYLENE